MCQTRLRSHRLAGFSTNSKASAEIPITTATKLVDDGYTGQIEPQLTLTLTRTSVRKRTFTGLQNVFTG